MGVTETFNEFGEGGVTYFSQNAAHKPVNELAEETEVRRERSACHILTFEVVVRCLEVL